MTIDLSLVIIGLLVLVLIVLLAQTNSGSRPRDKTPTHHQDAPQVRASAPLPPEPRPTIAVPLTPRERDIVRLVAQDMTNDEIARELHIGKRTVEKHLENIYRKINTRSRAELKRLRIDDNEP